MHRYKLTLAYNGSSFAGWQKQPHAPSIQGAVEEVLTQLTQEPILVIGAGRTDAGVHALHQIAHFDVSKPVPSAFMYHLNCVLPATIRALAIEAVSPSFHALHDVLTKEYHYHLWLEQVIDPFISPFRYHVRYPLDIPSMQACAELFLGTHDFTSFCNIRTQVRHKTRTLSKIRVVEQEGGVRIEYVADGFLYKMVRNLTTALLEVGRHRHSLDQIEEILHARNREQAFAPAPPHALFLMHVTYQSKAGDM